jgi:hypothetical protein
VETVPRISCLQRGEKVKVVPLHSMEQLWVTGGIAPLS